MGPAKLSFFASALFAFVFAGALGARANEAPASVLQAATTSTALISACRELATKLYVQVPASAKASRSSEGDAAITAIRAFVLSDADLEARERCAGDLKGTRMVAFVDTTMSTTVKSAYGNEASEILLSMLHSPDDRTRLIAARALWGMHDGNFARPMIEVAVNDRCAGVRAAAFRNVSWPMQYNLADRPDRSPFEAAIERGLHDEPVVVAGALYAKAVLDGLNAEAVLESYALSPDSDVRRGAIGAFDGIGYSRRSIVRFLESRLSDPDRSVRKVVMLELFRQPADTTPAFELFEATAPTDADRTDAQEYLRALRDRAARSDF